MKDIKPHFYKRLYVAPSKISGNGLFAGEDICKGEIILSFGGMLASTDERNSDKYISSTYSGIAETIMICESSDSVKDFSDYINHSCEPNVGMDDCITLRAISEIKEGTELLCDYAFWEADCNWVLRNQCNCGSIHCRRSITGKDWMKVSSQNPMFQFYSPFLQRRIIQHEKKT